MTAKIVWLASYPKSGNTWVRVLLTNYLSDVGGEPDLNRLIGAIASRRDVFDELAGVESSELTAAQISSMRPQVYRQLAGEHEGTIFLKIHDTLDGNDGLIPRDVTAVALYVIRNPADVAVSLAAHMDCSIAQAVHYLCHGLVLAPHQFRLREQLEQHLSTWQRHVLSWVNAPRMKVHVVRFEDLHRDAVSTLASVVDAIGLPHRRDRVVSAVERSRFEHLQYLERARGFGERRSRASPFFRQGSPGEGRLLDSEQIRLLIAANGLAMRQFGYLTADGAAVS